MSDLATFTVRRDGDLLVAALTGEIDPSNASDLERSIVDAVPNDALGMLLDLTGLGYLDSAGVRLLLALADRFRWRGQQLGLVAAPDSRARKVLAMAGAESALVIEASEADARARLASSG